MHRERPVLVGLICWVLIIANMVGIFLTMKQLGSPSFADGLAVYPYPPWLAGAILFGTMALSIVCGICMYEEQGWARFIYIVEMIPFFVQNYFDLPHALKPGIAKTILIVEFVLYLLSIVILFLPKARRYYHPPQYVDE